MDIDFNELLNTITQKYSFIILDLKTQHLLVYLNLTLHHLDPFDRIIIAQSKSEKVKLLYTDEVFELYKNDNNKTTMSSLPKKIVEELGLLIEPENQVRLVYADGRKKSVPKANGLTIIMFGRNWTGSCICQENSEHVIIGQIPLEQMDLVVDYNK